MEIKKELDDVEAVAKVLMAARDPALDSARASPSAAVSDAGRPAVDVRVSLPPATTLAAPEASLR